MGSQIYRLCVKASGSLIMDIFNFLTFTKLSLLHLGQNKGNLTSSVSSRILTLVLLLHSGQMIHSAWHITLSP